MFLEIIQDFPTEDTSLSSSVDIVTFILQNTILLAGGGLFCLSLLVSCAAFVFMGALKLKHNRLRRRVKNTKRKKPGV